MSDHTHRTVTTDRGIYCNQCCQFLRLDPVSLKWEPIDEAPIVRSNWDPNVKPFNPMLGSTRKHTFGEPAPEPKQKKRRTRHEDGDQMRLVKHLRDLGEIVIRCEQGGERSPQKALREKMLGMFPDAADLIWVRPNGVVVWIECKATKANGGRVRPSQAEHHTILRSMGHMVLVGYGSEDLIAQCEAIRAESR
jgi:hypothetical protein